jgi:4-hydroxybenzoate polyprenyltransferase
MVWQDVVIAICQLTFIPAMLPTVFGKNKPEFSTSLMNFVIVMIISTCLLSLRLWFAWASALPIALIWLTLALQTRPQKWRKISRK